MLAVIWSPEQLHPETTIPLFRRPLEVISARNLFWALELRLANLKLHC